MRKLISSKKPTIKFDEDTIWKVFDTDPRALDKHFENDDSPLVKGGYSPYKDIESFHKDMRKNYYEAIPGIHSAIRDRQFFFRVEPYEKDASRTRSIIQIIKKEKNYN